MLTTWLLQTYYSSTWTLATNLATGWPARVFLQVLLRRSTLYQVCGCVHVAPEPSFSLEGPNSDTCLPIWGLSQLTKEDYDLPTLTPKLLEIGKHVSLGRGFHLVRRVSS